MVLTNRIQPVLRRSAKHHLSTTAIAPTVAHSSATVPHIGSSKSRNGGGQEPGRIARRWQSTGRRKVEPRYNFNTALSWNAEPDPDHAKYRRVTAKDLRHRREPPTRVKMLVRDFIDDSLYNPHYGYFSKQATIFSSSTPSSSASTSSASPASTGFDITSFPNLTAFQESVAAKYEDVYGEIIQAESTEVENGQAGKGVEKGGLGRQVWHTPTELFRPHYSRIITEAIHSNYKLRHYPYTDLNIYEIGAGNGSLSIDMMNHLKQSYPDVFERARYTIVEISEALAGRQRERIREEGLEGKVEVVNKDFFDWEGGTKEGCYFVALEVLDNFAHDMLRYDIKTLTPLQATVCIDSSGDFSLLYEPVTDPIIRRYLSYRRHVPSLNNLTSLYQTPPNLPPLNPLLNLSPLLRSIYAALPFAPNLSQPEYVPTKQMLFLEKLREKLPNHRLLISDFDALPDAVAGRNGPVVQTRYGGSMIPCETFLVKQGYFDIFFPTDFEMLRDMYEVIMTTPANRRLSSSFFSRQPTPGPSTSTPDQPDLIGSHGFKHRHVELSSHADFLEKWGNNASLSGTTTKDGTNVMLGMYNNAKFMF